MKSKLNIRTATALAVACSVLLALSGCADSNTLTDHARDAMSAPAGFWRGIWHGICAPFSFIGIMFGMDIGIYEPFNTGNWYNFGFLLGIGALGGGSSSATTRKG